MCFVLHADNLHLYTSQWHVYDIHERLSNLVGSTAQCASNSPGILRLRKYSFCGDDNFYYHPLSHTIDITILAV